MCEICAPSHGPMSYDAQIEDDRADRDLERRQNPNRT